MTLYGAHELVSFVRSKRDVWSPVTLNSQQEFIICLNSFLSSFPFQEKKKTKSQTVVRSVKFIKLMLLLLVLYQYSYYLLIDDY